MRLSLLGSVTTSSQPGVRGLQGKLTQEAQILRIKCSQEALQGRLRHINSFMHECSAGASTGTKLSLDLCGKAAGTMLTGDLSAKPGGLSGEGMRLQACEAAEKGRWKECSRRRLCRRSLEVSRDTNEGGRPHPGLTLIHPNVASHPCDSGSSRTMGMVAGGSRGVQTLRVNEG